MLAYFRLLIVFNLLCQGSIGFAQSEFDDSISHLLKQECFKRNQTQSASFKEVLITGNSKGTSKNMDTFYTRFFNRGAHDFVIWTKTSKYDQILLDSQVYRFYHFQKKMYIYSLEEFTGDFAGLLGMLYFDLDSCNYTEKFKLMEFVRDGNSINYTLYKDTQYRNMTLTNINVHVRMKDTVVWYRDLKFDMKGVTFENKSEFLELSLNDINNQKLEQEIRDYISKWSMKYERFTEEKIEKELPFYTDSLIFNVPWKFYNLDSQVFVQNDRIPLRIIMFSFQGCIPCVLMKFDLNQWIDSFSIPVDVLIVNPIDGVAAIKEEASLSKNNFYYLMADSAYLKTQFGIKAYPTVIVLDNQNRILLRHQGYHSALIRKVRDVIKDRT